MSRDHCGIYVRVITSKQQGGRADIIESHARSQPYLYNNDITRIVCSARQIAGVAVAGN